jgi:hypothetical protein
MYRREADCLEQVFAADIHWRSSLRCLMVIVGSRGGIRAMLLPDNSAPDFDLLAAPQLAISCLIDQLLMSQICGKRLGHSSEFAS